MNKKTFTILGVAALLLTSCDWFNPTPAKTVTLESISLSEYSTEYVVDSEFSFDGVVTAHYSDNSSKTVTPTYVSQPNMSTAGEKDVTVTYTEKNVSKYASYTITVTNEPGPGPSGEEINLTKFNQLKNNILTGHNYTAKIEGKFEDEEDLFADYSLYNINDEVIYTDNSEYFNKGYIKQKNQGVIEFYQNKESGVIVPGDFICTNTQRSMSELYVLALEGVLDVTFSANEENKNYSASGRDPIAIMGNLALGDYIIWASAPEGNKFTAVTQGNFTKLILSARFVYNYQSTESGSLDDTFKQVPFDVTITISNVGSTSNSSLEEYVANPSYVYPDPTSFDEYDEEILKQHFGDAVPPFITGLTYSYRCSETLVSGKYYGIVEDYASGNLTNSYGDYLQNNGYTMGENGKYTKVLKDDDRKIESTWTVVLNYLSPNEEDEYGMKYGYLYPNGVFTALFRYDEKTTEAIETVAQLNDYISKTDAAGFLPEIPSGYGITKVSKFADGTAAAEAVDGADFALVAPTSGGYFRLYIEDYDVACSFIRAYGALLETRGMETQGIGRFVFCSWVDDYFSKVTFGDIEFAYNASTYVGYVEMQISIYQASVDNWDGGTTQEKTLSSITLSGQTRVFNVDSEFSFDGVCTAHYSDGSSKEVTPTSVSSPDMSSLGEKTVKVTYTEDGVTVEETYLIEVKTSVNLYTISLNAGTGTTINVSKPTSLNGEAGTIVSFTVTLDTDYSDLVVSVTCNGQPVQVTGPNVFTGAYQFTLPAGNVIISTSATYSGSAVEFGGEYSMRVPVSETSKAYSDYVFDFKEDGTGTYKRYQVNSEGVTVYAYTIYFTYTYKDSKIKITFKSMDSNTMNPSFQNYRLFVAIDTSSTDPIINDTGVDNGDGTFTIMLVDSSGAGKNYTFTK